LFNLFDSLGNNRGTFYFPYGRKGIVDWDGSRDGSRGGIRVGNASIASMGSGKASVASGKASVASGKASVASGKASVASGKTSVASGKTSVASRKASITNGKASIASGKASKELGIPFFLLGTSGHENDSKNNLKQLLIIEQTNITVTTVLIFPSFE
jgi:autotransporter adhesin